MIAAADETHADPHEVSLDLNIETPENVVLTYQLAGPSVRCVAYLVDLAVRMVFSVAAFVAIMIAFGALAPGAGIGVFLVMMFVVNWFYYVISEGCFNGRSIGKSLMKLRVIQEQGHPVTFWPVMLRNLMRAFDDFPMTFYLPAMISMVYSGRMQRLGDLLAGTVVIEESTVRVPRQPRILEKIRPIPREELGAFVPPERTLLMIDDFLSRRQALTHERGHALAKILARPLAERLGYTGDPAQIDKYPMAFLARVHVTFIRREEPEDHVKQEPPQRERQPIGAGR